MKFVEHARYETTAFSDLLVVALRFPPLCSCPGPLRRARESSRRPWAWPWSERSERATGSGSAGAVVFDSSRFRGCRCWVVGPAEPVATTQLRFVADCIDAGSTRQSKASLTCAAYGRLRVSVGRSEPNGAARRVGARQPTSSALNGSRRLRPKLQRYLGLPGSNARLCPLCGLSGRLLRPSTTAIVNALYRCTSCGAVWLRDMRDPNAPPRVLVRPSN